MLKNIIKNTIMTLLNPISPIVTIFIGWLLTILVTEPNKRFPHIINFMIQNPFVIMIFILFWLIFSVVYTELQHRIKNMEEKIHLNQEVIKEKEIQLKHTSGIVLNRSGDFANFNRLLRFNEVLKGFTENNTIVECVQLYSYSTKRVNDKVIIKVIYNSSFCSDGVDINNLAQCYYDINYNDYIKLKNIISIWKKLSSDDHMQIIEKDSMIKILVDGINDIYRRYYETLRNISDISKIKNCNFTQYRILTLLSRIARRKAITMFDKYTILGQDKAEIEDFLLNGKRMGILNSILLEDIFMFKYTRNSHKKGGRAYISFPLNITMQNYICIFSIQILELDKNIDLEYEIKSLKEDIIKRFEKSSILFP